MVSKGLTLKILRMKCFLLFLTASQICPGLSEKHLCSGDFLTLKYPYPPPLPSVKTQQPWVTSPRSLHHISSLPHLPQTSLYVFLQQFLWSSFLPPDFNCYEFTPSMCILNWHGHIDNSFENSRFPLAGLISNDLISFSHLEALNGIIAWWLLWQETLLSLSFGWEYWEYVKMYFFTVCFSPHKYYLTSYDVKMSHWRFTFWGILSYKIIDCLKAECVISLPNPDV